MSEPPSDNKKCAPTKKYDNGSCFTLDALMEITKAYNADIASNQDKIPLKWTSDHDLHAYKKYLVQQLTEKLSHVCDQDQICWLKQAFMKKVKPTTYKEISKNTFAPKGPNGKFTWLNTTNINQVMEQYESKYKDFKFFGAVPIDFDDLPELKIFDLNFKQLSDKNTNQLGFVFNLDEHWKSGSHWVALYGNLKKGQIDFFDSYGIAPDKRIKALMKRMQAYCKEAGLDAKLRYNKFRHQYKNSECGVYSLNFIIRLLDGDLFEDITKNKTYDDEINLYRNIYFRKK